MAASGCVWFVDSLADEPALPNFLHGFDGAGMAGNRHSHIAEHASSRPIGLGKPAVVEAGDLAFEQLNQERSNQVALNEEAIVAV